MTPAMAPSMSASVGWGLAASRAAALMIWPDWQYPHWGTSSSAQAAWTFWPSGVAPMASMVTIFLPAAAETGVLHERMGWPSMCTVQAPHSAMPQPNLVPVIPRVSRMTHSSGVSGSTSTLWAWPLTSRLIMGSSHVAGLKWRHHMPRPPRKYRGRERQAAVGCDAGGSITMGYGHRGSGWHPPAAEGGES